MDSQKYRLQEIAGSAAEREWLDFPKHLYRGYSNWVCPLDDDIREVFDLKRNELFKDGEAVRWVVRDASGEIVGRIAAFYNREKAALEEQPTGCCGFFECIDSQQVADMLFDAARMWLASRGMEAMDGPVNFGQRSDWWGLLVEGYEFQPLYKNPYNPSYYKELFENYGFRNYFNQHSFIWRKDTSEANRQILVRAERLYTTPGYHVEPLDMHNLEETAENFRVVYNRAWALFSGVKPMTREEALVLLRRLKPILDPEIVFFAYFNQEPIGFFVTVPDLNRLIGKFNGKFGLWQKLRLMWDLKDTSEANRQILVRAERLYTTPGYHVEPLDMHNLEETAENFRVVYNRAWALFSGVKPMTREEALVLLRRLKPILDPEIVFFAYFNQEPIGFFVTVPDLNRLIGKFNGKFGLWQKLRLMWDLKVRRKCDRIFGIIFGIAPEYHGKGVESAIMAEYWKYLDRKDIPYKTLELAWIGDFNPVMNRMIENYVCASRHKIHTTYRYLFDRTREFHRCPRLNMKRREE